MQNLNAGFVKPTLYNVFLYILFNFLIDAIKHNVGNKFKTCFILFVSVQNKTSFVSFHVMFSGGNKNFTQNKRESSCEAYVLNSFKERNLYIIMLLIKKLIT